jgi:hypothetical protein
MSVILAPRIHPITVTGRSPCTLLTKASALFLATEKGLSITFEILGNAIGHNASQICNNCPSNNSFLHQAPHSTLITDSNKLPIFIMVL